MKRPIKLKSLLFINESTSIEQDNKEILNFLIKNSNKINVPLTIFRRKEFKDVKSLVKELTSIIKKPGYQLKIGMLDKKSNVRSYDYKKRSEMEKLLNSGNLGGIDIEYVNRPSMERAIDKFGTSA